MRPRAEFTLSDGSPLTPQEQFVLKQAAAGEVADLKEKFGEAEEERRLRARFLEELLTGGLPGVRIHRRGVRISQAVIQEPLHLENAEVVVEVWLDTCIFKGLFSIMDAFFNYHLSLNGSHFLKGAVFHRLNLAGSIFCRNTVFAGPVDFAAADIKGQFVAQGVKFLAENQKANFNSMKVGQDAFFAGAEFHGAADFTAADIKGQFGAQGVKFLGEDYVPNFNGLQVGQDAFFDGGEFRGPVNFGGADIKGQFVAKWATFLAEDRKANFNGLQVGQVASFDGAEFHGAVDFVAADIKGRFEATGAKFHGSVDFGGADIKGQFSAKGARFLAADQKAIFNGMQVGKGAFFDEAEFHGLVNFVTANIKGQLGQFSARRAKFLGKDQEANFNGMQVGQNAFFDAAEFHGPVDFGGADIKGQFVANEAKFLASEHKVDFHRMEVGQDAFFQGCDFQGLVSFVLSKIAGDLHLEPLQLKIGQKMSTSFHSGVNFRGAEIGGELWADKAQFLGHISDFEAVKVGRSFHASGAIFAGSAYFTEMAVKRNFFLDPFGGLKSFKTLFKGAANFSRLEVGGVFNADQAIFKSESTIFSGLKVGQGTFFIGAIFFGGLVLKEAQLSDLEIRGLYRLSVGGLPLEEIVLNRAKIAHRLTIEDIEVKRFDARNLEVKGPAELLRLAIKSEADLRDASLYHLQLVEPGWPAPQDGHKQVHLDGLTYETLTTKMEAKSKENWREILGWLQQSSFNSQNYGQLEGFFQRGGNKECADEVFIRGKQRAQRRRRWWSPGRWGTLFLWDWLAGYGRKPMRILGVSLVIILIGAFTFDPQVQAGNTWLMQMDPQHPWLAHLFLSLDRFFPLIDIGGSQKWNITDVSLFTGIWWQAQKICGWIMTPIALAAVYTRLK